jgi:membrane-associated protein
MSAALAVNILSPHSLLSSFGPTGVGVVLFAETGLLIGFFLPGDSLLFTAGVLSAAPATAALHLSLGWVLVAAIIGACLGAQTGYLLGRRAGPAFFDRNTRPKLEEGRHRAAEYLERYGHARAIVLARFIPIVRTVLNPLAGVIGIPTRTFTIWQLAGGIVWSVGVTLAGYWLGSSIHNVDHYLLPIIGVIVLISLMPIAIETLRNRRRTAARTRHDAA